MRGRLLKGPAALAALAFATAAAQDPRRPRKVLIMAVDGTRADALLAADAPALQGLIARGAYSLKAQAAVGAEDFPVSGSSYSSMLTGVWCAKHRVCENEFAAARFDLHPIFFCRYREVDPRAVVESIVRWSPLSSNLIECAEIDLAPSTDAKATQEAVRLLRDTDPDVLFYHIEDVDTAGHRYGFSPAAQGYLDAIEASDARVAAVLDALRARPTYAEEDWLIFALSDHGGRGTDHHSKHPETQTIFFAMDGPWVEPGEIDPPPEVVDVAATAMVYLGMAIDPAWNLDGRVVGLRADPLQPHQLPGDCDQTGDLGIGDAICILSHLFAFAPGPLPCRDGTLGGANLVLLDVNGDAALEIGDPVYLLGHLFAEGPPPAAGMGCVPLLSCPDACPR